MPNERLSTLTARQAEDLATTDAMRLLVCGATLNVGPTGAAREFLRRFPHATHAQWIEKAATATVTTTGSGQPLLPPVLADALTKLIQTASILTRIPGVVRAPLMTPVPFESQAPELAWTPESGPEPAADIAFGQIRLLPYKAAGIVVMSTELARLQAGTEAVISRRLTAASTRFVNREFLNPARAGVVGLNPPSITNGAATVTPSGNLVDDIAALESLFFTNRPDAAKPTYIASPGIIAAIAGSGTHPSLRTDGGYLHGVPVVATPGAQSTLVLLDAEGIVVHDGGAELDTSRYATPQTSTLPDNPPTAGTVPIDLWSSNLIGLRLDRFVSWAAEPTAVAYLAVA